LHALVVSAHQHHCFKLFDIMAGYAVTRMAGHCLMVPYAETGAVKDDCRYKDECHTERCQFWHPRDAKGKGKGKGKADLFRAIDIDGDGVVTRAELDRAVHAGVLGSKGEGDEVRSRASRKAFEGDKGKGKTLCQYGATCRNKGSCKYSHPHTHKLDLTTSRLILVSDNLEGHEFLLRALHDHVISVSVKYDVWELEDLTKAIRRAAGEPNHQFASVAFMDHGDEGFFHLLKKLGGPVDMTRLNSNPALMIFFAFIAGYVRSPVIKDQPLQDLTARIDLFSCNTGRGKKGKELLQFLEGRTGVNWAASTDKTGKDGGYFDYAMETEEHLGLPSVHPCYWDEQRLKKWEGLCFVICATIGAAIIASTATVSCKVLDKVVPDAK